MSLRVYCIQPLPEYGHSGGGPDPRCTGGNHSQCGVRIANAAGRFDAEFAADGLAHQGDVGRGRAAGAEAGGSLYEVCAAVHGKPAGADFFIIGEEARLEDNFDGAAAGSPDNLAQLMENISIVSLLEPADVEHGVDFPGAVGSGGFCLDALGSCGHGAQREAHGGGDCDARSLEQPAGVGNPGSVDADAAESVFACFGAELFDVF